MGETLLSTILSQLTEIANLLGEWLGEHLINIIAILIGAWIVRHFSAGFISRLLKRTVRPDLYPTKVDREKRIKTLDSLIGAFVRLTVFIVAAILIIGEINPDYTTALFTSAGLIGVALGFGAKDLVNDFISGIFVITENQYRVGDVIEIGGQSGLVEDITIRTTILRDLSGNVHHVPNGTIGITKNMSLGFSRINEEIMVAYDTDIAKLEHVINHVGEKLAADPEHAHKIIVAPKFVRIQEFADSGIIVKILGKVVAGEQWDIAGEYRKLLKTAFEKNHIEIPYPQLVVRKTK